MDLDFLARRFAVTGGNIRNIAVAAAFLAADNGSLVSMSHPAAVPRSRSTQKMGEVVGEGEFEHCEAVAVNRSSRY